MKIGTQGRPFGAMHRRAVFAEKHGIGHLCFVFFAGVVFNFLEDRKFSGACLLAGTSGDDIEFIDHLEIIHCIEHLVMHIDKNSFLRPGFAVFNEGGKHQTKALKKLEPERLMQWVNVPSYFLLSYIYYSACY